MHDYISSFSLCFFFFFFLKTVVGVLAHVGFGFLVIEEWRKGRYEISCSGVNGSTRHMPSSLRSTYEVWSPLFIQFYCRSTSWSLFAWKVIHESLLRVSKSNEHFESIKAFRTVHLIWLA